MCQVLFQVLENTYYSPEIGPCRESFQAPLIGQKRKASLRVAKDQLGGTELLWFQVWYQLCSHPLLLPLLDEEEGEVEGLAGRGNGFGRTGTAPPSRPFTSFLVLTGPGR